MRSASWVDVLTAGVDYEPLKRGRKYTTPTKTADSLDMLRKYIKENPGQNQKAMVDDLGWELSKLQRLLQLLKPEMYSGYVLKSQVTVLPLAP